VITARSAGGRTSREAWSTVAVLVAVTVAAWAVLVVAGETMSAPAFLAAWLVMMAAMMLPSAAPLVFVYRRGASPTATVGLVAGYLAVWGAVGVGAFAADRAIDGSHAAAAVLALAAAYELTPAKARFLRVCRSPVDFLMTRWRGTPAGAVRLGAEHGLYCLGCCWALMAVLVVAAAMGLGWALVIALAVFVEKVLPTERFWRFTIAAALAAFAVASLVN
jgi:predicted metal-binding membrane protein